MSFGPEKVKKEPLSCQQSPRKLLQVQHTASFGGNFQAAISNHASTNFGEKSAQICSALNFDRQQSAKSSDSYGNSISEAELS